jgi:hypothetical protein
MEITVSCSLVLVNADGSQTPGSSQLHASQMNTESPDDFFWKLSLIDHGDGCILASDKHLTRLDWRVRHIRSFSDSLV